MLQLKKRLFFSEYLNQTMTLISGANIDAHAQPAENIIVSGIRDVIRSSESTNPRLRGCLLFSEKKSLSSIVIFFSLFLSVHHSRISSEINKTVVGGCFTTFVTVKLNYFLLLFFQSQLDTQPGIIRVKNSVLKGAQRSKLSGGKNMTLKCYFDRTEALLKAEANARCCVQSQAQVARQ